MCESRKISSTYLFFKHFLYTVFITATHKKNDTCLSRIKITVIQTKRFKVNVDSSKHFPKKALCNIKTPSLKCANLCKINKNQFNNIRCNNIKST